MRIGIYAGSFDPMTKGHLDVIERASQLVDQLIVAVLKNPNKKGFLQVDERLRLIEAATAHLSNVQTDSFSGLLIDYAKREQASVLIRGIRATKDLEMELDMAQINRQLSGGLETIFLMTSPEYAAVSSSVVREIISFNGDIRAFVPEAVYEGLQKERGK